MFSANMLSLQCRSIMLILAIAMGFVWSGVAQVSEATLTGTVADATRAVIPGATVTVENVGTKTARKVTTDAEGRYRASNLQPGKYEIRAEQPGFKTVITRGIQLTVGQQAVVNLVLEVGEVTQQIVVTGEVPLVETRTATTSNLIGTAQIRELPLNGRDLIQLALLGTGITQSLHSASNVLVGTGKKLSVGGSRPQSNSFLLDGININSNTNTSPGSVVGVQLGVDTILEFRVITNALSAEYGRVAGGVISQVTKSGTNAFHGSAFEFHRNDNFDARNFFDPGPPAEFKRNQFGSSAGGPIRRDKMFFFGSYEAFVERLGLSNLGVVPTALARQGKLPDPQAPGGIRDVGVNPLIKPYVDFYPLPNGRDFGDGRGEFFSSPSKPADEHYFMVRSDLHLSPNSSLFARYVFDNAKVSIPHVNAMTKDDLRTRNQYLTLAEDHVFGASRVNSFRAAFNRSLAGEADSWLISFPQNLLFRPDNPAALPNMVIGGLAEFGGYVLRPRTYISNVYQFADDFSLNKGRHSIKLGANYERIQFNQRSDYQAGGYYAFLGLSDFLQARPYLFGMQFPESDTIRGLRQNLLGIYFQDEIQAVPNMTLTVGLRYEVITSPTEVNGKLFQLVNFASPEATLQDIKMVDSLFENPSLKNFAPRIGVAWDLLGNGRISVRGGIGIFYDQLLSPYWQLGSIRMPPVYRGTTITSAQIGGPLLFPNWQDMGFRTALPGFEGFLNNPDSPYVIKWNVGVDRQMAKSFAVRLGYMGVRGVHLPRAVGVNLNVPTQLPDGRLFFPPERVRVYNPNFASVRNKLTDGTTNYHGFELSVIKQSANGIGGQFSYTLSKAIDDGAAVIGGFDIGGDFALPRSRFIKDRGLSPFDVRHNAVFNLSYVFPKSDLHGAAKWILDGWEATNITTLASGHPFSAVLGFVPPGFSASPLGDIVYYPDLRSGQTNNPRRGGPDNYFDGSAFAVPQAGFVGNLGRNTLIGPGMATVDFSVLKQTSVGENKNIEFRAEFFNIFNHANLGLPQTSVFFANGAMRSDVGRITATITTSRQIQFGLKFSW